MTEQEFSARAAALGGCVYIVGGWVRDKLRGVAAHDKDYAVTGLSREVFEQNFTAQRVGRAFPVYLLTVDGQKCEVAFARTECKAGSGYTGFAVSYTPDVTIEADLYRRDTAMNSMAIRVADGQLIDPYGGQDDIAKHQIRPVSEHFADDPVRALRAARQAAELEFTLTAETLALMKKCRAELSKEPPERLLAELKKALAAPRPSVFLAALAEAELLEAAFPWLYKLIGQTQPPQYHPEGDAFAHTLAVVDITASQTESLDARFCALVHDLGKGLTPKDELPHHIGHETAGLKALADWNRRMTLPKQWLKKASLVIREHMRLTTMRRTGKIVDFIVEFMRNPLETAELAAVIRADHGSLPPVVAHCDELCAAISSLDYKALLDGAEMQQIPERLRAARIKACAELLKQWETA